MSITQYPPLLNNYTIVTSSTRPSSPYTGQAIYETDTARLLIYVAGNWYPSWNQPWGYLGRTTGVGTAFDATSPTQATLSSIETFNGRVYEVVFDMTARSAVSDTIVNFSFDIDTGGGYVAQRSFRDTFSLGSAVNSSESFHHTLRYLGGVYSAVTNFRVVSSRITGTASVTTPAEVNLAVYDMGPTAGPY